MGFPVLSGTPGTTWKTLTLKCENLPRVPHVGVVGADAGAAGAAGNQTWSQGSTNMKDVQIYQKQKQENEILETKVNQFKRA